VKALWSRKTPAFLHHYRGRIRKSRHYWIAADLRNQGLHRLADYNLRTFMSYPAGKSINAVR